MNSANHFKLCHIADETLSSPPSISLSHPIACLCIVHTPLHHHTQAPSATLPYTTLPDLYVLAHGSDPGDGASGSHHVE